MLVRQYSSWMSAEVSRTSIRQRRLPLQRSDEKYVTINDVWGRQFKETHDRRPYLYEHKDAGTPLMLFPSQEAVDTYIEHEELKKWVAECSHHRELYERLSRKDWASALARYDEIDVEKGLMRYHRRYVRRKVGIYGLPPLWRCYSSD